MTKRGNILLPLISAVVLVALLAAGYLFWQNQQLQTTNSLAPTPTETPIQDETANWKTYENKEYGYSFRYPNNWKIEDLSPNGKLQSVLVRGFLEKTQNNTSVMVRVENKNTTCFPTDIKCYSQNELETYESGGNNGLLVDSFLPAPGGQDTSQKLRVVFFENNNLLYSLSQQRAAKDEGILLKQFDQILSTFKFFEPERNGSCTSSDPSLCELVAIAQNAVRNGDMSTTEGYIAPTQITCYIKTENVMPPPQICEGKNNGDKVDGYPIGYYQSEGNVFDKEGFIKSLNGYFNNPDQGKYSYEGLVSDNSRAAIVFSTDSNDFVSLMIKKENGNWHIFKAVVSVGGGGSNEFTNLNPSALDFID